jgi:hypothetical protein
MLRRIRKIEDTNIVIFNYSGFKLCNFPCITYEETKAQCIALKDRTFKRTYKQEGNITKISYNLDSYDEIYIYNKTEEENSSRNRFLMTFLAMADKKGFQYELLDDEDNSALNQEHRLNWRIEELLQSKDISNQEAQALQMKTNKLEDTKDDKLKLDRHFIKFKLGVDTLDEDILKAYHYKYHHIMNFTALIDDANIPITNDNHHDELKCKVPIINELIQHLGFKHVFDTDKLYNKSDFENNIVNMKGIN